MKFVRENMFLVILGGAVLVLGGLFIGINLFSLSDSVDAEIQARENLSKSLQAFANGKKINQEMVNQQKKRVQSIRADANQVTVDQQELNKAAGTNTARRRSPARRSSGSSPPTPSSPRGARACRRGTR